MPQHGPFRFQCANAHEQTLNATKLQPNQTAQAWLEAQFSPAGLMSPLDSCWRIVDPAAHPFAIEAASSVGGSCAGLAHHVEVMVEVPVLLLVDVHDGNTRGMSVDFPASFSFPRTVNGGTEIETYELIGRYMKTAANGGHFFMDIDFGEGERWNSDAYSNEGYLHKLSAGTVLHGPRTLNVGAFYRLRGGYEAARNIASARQSDAASVHHLTCHRSVRSSVSASPSKTKTAQARGFHGRDDLYQQVFAFPPGRNAELITRLDSCWWYPDNHDGTFCLRNHSETAMDDTALASSIITRMSEWRARALYQPPERAVATGRLIDLSVSEDEESDTLSAVSRGIKSDTGAPLTAFL